MVVVPGDDDECQKRSDLFGSFPWGRIGLDLVLAHRTQHSQWFCRELVRAARSTTLAGITFLSEDEDKPLSRAESLLHAVPGVGAVWLGREHNVSNADIEELATRIASASAEEVGAAICREIERNVSHYRRRYSTLPSSRAIHAFVTSLAPTALDEVRVASGNETSLVLDRMQEYRGQSTI